MGTPEARRTEILGPPTPSRGGVLT